MKFLYQIFIELLVFGMNAGGLFSYKIKRGLAGRRQSLAIVQKSFEKHDIVIWMHAASLGEYEQGLPVLQKLKEYYPHHKILITFFSPSGYENVVKKQTIADAICYLPFDLKNNVELFTQQFKTEFFFTVKYDYWYHLLQILKGNGTKTFVISALFYENQIFFKPYGSYFRKQLRKNIDWFFHQTKNSYALAKTIQLNNSSIAGDTRFDRVKQFLQRDNRVDYIAEFKNENRLLVFGSSWEAEEKIAFIIKNKIKNCKIIIAPHDVSRVEIMREKFSEAILYSEIEVNDIQLKNAKILIIDSIGLLSKIYHSADLAVVGGGFHKAGLHNILEAAIFGIPVLFGNHYQKNPEADALIVAKGGQSFKEVADAAQFLIKILAEDSTKEFLQMGKNAENFVASQPNSTEIIVKKMISL